MSTGKRLRTFIRRCLRTPVPQSTLSTLDSDIPEPESVEELTCVTTGITTGRPDDVCAHCWEGVFAARFGLRSVPVYYHSITDFWAGGYEWFVSYDELTNCKNSNCMWYRCLGPDAFGAMSRWFEDKPNNARVLLSVGRPASAELTGPPESHVLVVVIDMRNSFRISIGSDNPSAAWTKDWAGTLRVKASDVLDWAKMSVDECLREHQACQDFYGWARLEASLPTRLIDCSDARHPHLVETKGWDPNLQYIALSYAWGSRQQPNRTVKKNISSYLKAIHISLLPKTIIDAIQVTHALGIRYLWVDSLCIIQDSLEDKHRELSMMRHVYHQAFLVIDAARATNASQGFLDDSHCIQMEASIWLPFNWSRRHDRNPRQFMELLDDWPRADLLSCGHSVRMETLVIRARGHTGRRAWCLQEALMSGRRLCFAWSLQFHCRQSLQQRAESPLNYKWYGATSPPDIVFRRTTSLVPYSADWFTIHAAWSEIVEDYTLRSLSYSEDTFLACAGIAEAFGLALGSRTEYLAGLWRDSLLFDLLWFVTDHSGRIRGRSDSLAPSWSWAVTRHPVVFRPYQIYRNKPAATLSGWEELGEVIGCAVTLENCALPFGRVTGGHLVLRAPLLGPYIAEDLHSNLSDPYQLGWDDLYDPNDQKRIQQSLWLTPLLYASFQKGWVIYSLVIQLQVEQLHTQAGVGSASEREDVRIGVYRRVGACTRSSLESEGGKILDQLQVVSLRSKVDGQWTFPRKEMVLI
ncbi:HET-domain-containing protein [Cubamyces sp. BRFM 1775]|nr:HET-domain-containing protein [Cubamyces sp. BRFM 1775]